MQVKLRGCCQKNFPCGGAERAASLVEDDGPGIAAQDRITALSAGNRLDTSKSGSGLGLAISTDLLKVYDSSLELGDSALLGGLAVRILIPQRLGASSPARSRNA